VSLRDRLACVGCGHLAHVHTREYGKAGMVRGHCKLCACMEYQEPPEPVEEEA
jgi:hypothetical protein